MIQQTTLQQYCFEHQSQLLALLWDMNLHSNDQVIQVAGKQYNARILELRRQGWEIVSVRENGKFYFQMKSKMPRWVN